MGPRKALANKRTAQDSKYKEFLHALVNAQLTKAKDQSGDIFHDYPEFLPHAPRSPQEVQQNSPLLMALMRRRKEFDPRRLPEGREPYQLGIVAEMRDRLRAVWKAGDAEAAKWRLAGFESFMHVVMSAGSTAGPPPPDASPPESDATAPKALPPQARLSKALAYLGRNLRKLKKCARRGCPHPLFVGGRREDQYCTDECADKMRSRYKEQCWDRKRKGLAVPKRGEPKPVAEKGAAKSIGSRGEQPTIVEPELKAFILDVVNADEGKMDDGKLYFFIQYPRFFPSWERDVEAVASLAWRNPTVVEALRDEFPKKYHGGLIRDLCEGLRSVWQTEYEAAAQRKLFRLHSLVHRQTDIRSGEDRGLQPPPAHAPIHEALGWVRQHLQKLRKCGNGGCAHPYFMAEGKRRFCSEECARVGQRASKLRSWRKHGQEWRRKKAEGMGGREAPVPNPDQN